MSANWFVDNFDIVWLQIILLFLGIIFIIIALFRPKDNTFIEGKVEGIFEDFITQINVENEEIINRIKDAQNQLPFQINEKINLLEKRVEKIEREYSNNYKASVQMNQKYEEVLSMYENGEDVNNIAKKTNMGHAEIKLILELSKKGFKYV